MILRPPRSTRTDTLFPYTTLFRSVDLCLIDETGGDVDGDHLGRHLPLRRGDATAQGRRAVLGAGGARSEEHTSELQSLMRNSYAVFCLKKQQCINITVNIQLYHTYSTTTITHIMSYLIHQIN